MTLESAAYWTGVAAVAFALLAALAGGASWHLGLRVGNLKDAALLELQERSRPRTLDADARVVMAEFLQIGTHSAPVLLQFAEGATTEPRDLAAALDETLRAAGWTVTGLRGEPEGQNPPRGVTIRISDVGGVDVQASILLDALERGGMSPRLVKDRIVRAGEIWLRVGLKP